jgi:ABC-type uncharacterized transport system substrate-binding protein
MGTIKKCSKILSFWILMMCWLVPISDNAYAKDPVLIIRLEGNALQQTVEGIRAEIKDNFLITEMIIDKNAATDDISQKMKELKPKLVVLMDNIAVSLYKKYQKGLPDSSAVVPSVSLMASFMDLSIRDMKNATGIFYEVPLVTSVVNLRSVMPSVPLRKIGVVNREFMEQSVKINRGYCRKENIELVSHLISENETIKTELERALKLLKDNKIDALWVPNDNKIVNASLLKSVWIPFAEQFEKPIIVGVEVLVQPSFKFGTYAVIPDHVELGKQASEIIYDIMDNHWQAEGRDIEQPRSVYKIINMEQAQRLFRVDNEKLNNVDKILQ